MRPEDDLLPLVDRLGPRERETLLSFYRYLQWADDMRGLYHTLLWDGPVGDLKRAGLTHEQAIIGTGQLSECAMRPRRCPQSNSTRLGARQPGEAGGEGENNGLRDVDR
jgi:hypothetical protein